ncbi:MAG: hypothetical protein ABSG37_13520 [Candidatus Limnocylindrales bacterium]
MGAQRRGAAAEQPSPATDRLVSSNPAPAGQARVTRYPIRDASGMLLATHCREDGPTGKRMWWEQPDGRPGLGGLPLADLPLYAIERLRGSSTVVLVEGEKAAEALLAIGIQAVGTVTGAAATPSRIVLADLTGRYIVLWPDNDDVGRAHMERIGAALIGIAAGVSIINWPDAPEHGDAADFVTAGGTREDVEALIDGARPLPAVGSPGPAPAEPEPASAKPTKRSAADLIVELAMDRYDLARAEDGEPFAIDRAGPNVARMFRGGRASLRSTLAAIYAEKYGKVPPAQALVDALAVLEGRALGLPRRTLLLRSGRLDDGSVVIDLGDESGQAIVVASDGRRILNRAPVTFRRSELTSPLPEPTSGDLSDLTTLLNIAPDDRPLLLAHQVGTLLGIPVPIILFRGPAGAAKTSAARALARTIDPSPAPVRSVPKDPEGWAVTAGGSYVVVLDNIDTIPGWLSDALCRAVTGEGYLRRALYTDSAISVVAFRRAIILTGIDPGAMRGDLADRLLAIDLTAIDEWHRQDDAEVEAAFRAAHPAILGAVLDLTSAVLRTLPSIRLARRPRMADYGRVLAAVDAILGTSGLDRYMAQRGELQREAAEGDRVGAAVIAWMSSRAQWTGTATELLEAITPERRPKDWPTTPRGLSGALRRVAQPLDAAGIRMTFSQAGHDKRRIIGIERVGEQPSAPSADPALNMHRADGADGADGGFAPPRGEAEVLLKAASRIEHDDLAVEENYPRSAWDPDTGEDDPQADRWLSVPVSDPGVEA